MDQKSQYLKIVMNSPIFLIEIQVGVKKLLLQKFFLPAIHSCNFCFLSLPFDPDPALLN
jgi:hypothetical protein